MKSDENETQKPLSLESLEAQLRGLPSPKVPEGLEARLTAGIPAGPHKTVADRPRRYGLAVGAAIAAGVLLVALASLVQHGTERPGDSGGPVIAVSDDPREMIEREAASARLLAAARILAQQPGMQAEAQETYEYVARTYGDTSVARESLKQVQREKGTL